MCGSRYFRPLKIPPVNSALAHQNIERELNKHEQAVAKEVVFKGKQAEGFALLEELEFEKVPLQTPLDRNLPEGRCRRRLLTERVALLGVRGLLEHGIFGAPVFRLPWHAGSTSYGLEADVSGQKLVGSVVFTTADSLAERIQIAEDAVGRNTADSVELVIINFEDSANERREAPGAYRYVASPGAESSSRRNLLLVDIHSGVTRFYAE